MMAKSQREAYDNHRKNPDALRNKIMIVMDFKQKIIIGMSKDQVNQEYYKQEQRVFFL